MTRLKYKREACVRQTHRPRVGTTMIHQNQYGMNNMRSSGCRSRVFAAVQTVSGCRHVHQSLPERRHWENEPCNGRMHDGRHSTSTCERHKPGSQAFSSSKRPECASQISHVMRSQQDNDEEGVERHELVRGPCKCERHWRSAGGKPIGVPGGVSLMHLEVRQI